MNRYAQFSRVGRGKDPRYFCWRKVRYPSRSRARAAASDVYQRSGLALYSYECPLCGCWHNTKEKRG